LPISIPLGSNVVAFSDPKRFAPALVAESAGGLSTRASALRDKPAVARDS
jgi:hypothetical protein